MDRRPLLVIMTEPPAVAGLGAEHVARLRDAHPRVRLQVVDSAEALAAGLPEADGALTAMPLPPGVLQACPRLRWVHWIPTGVDGFLTPELAAADNIALTASKGP